MNPNLDLEPKPQSQAEPSVAQQNGGQTAPQAEPLVLRPFSPSAVEDLWVRVAEGRVLEQVSSASSGHCLRVEGLPRIILERLGAELARAGLTGVEVYLIDSQGASTGADAAWRVDAYKVVERRNAEQGVVVALLPPDVQLAAGDSIDISTFRSLPVSDLDELVERELLKRIPAALHASIQSTLLTIARERGRPASSQGLAFLATIAEQKSADPAIVGGALYELGLVPDFGLLDRPEELTPRLTQRNMEVLRTLEGGGRTALDRALSLPLADSDEGKALRSRLLLFFQAHNPARVAEWGRLVATNADYRGLALEHWPLGKEMPPIGTLRLDIAPLMLPRRADDQMPMLQPNGGAQVAWECSPKPADVPGLEHFQIQMLNSEGVEVWSSPLIKRGVGASVKRGRKLKPKDLEGLESGVHFFRVIALNEAGETWSQQARDPDAPEGKKTNESEDFFLLSGEDVVEPTDAAPTNISVSGIAEAELLARWAELLPSRIKRAKPLTDIRPESVTWLTSESASGEGAQAAVQFDIQRRYVVRLSQRLRRWERRILQSPQSGGHAQVRVGTQDQPGDWVERPLNLPPALAQARAQVFEALATLPAATDDAGGTPERGAVIALCDLMPHAGLILDYARKYLEWARSGDAQALLLDVVEARLPGLESLALLAPTHPLRLVWALQAQRGVRTWTYGASQIEPSQRREAEVVAAWRRATSSASLPPMLLAGSDEEGGTSTAGTPRAWMEAGTLAGGWGVFLPVENSGGRGLLSVLQERLGVGGRATEDVPVAALADKMEGFCRQHPYLSAITLNVINPGAAALVVRALEELDRRRSSASSGSSGERWGAGLPLRYEVRLFAPDPFDETVGRAFRDLIENPERLSEAAGRLVETGHSHLFPRLSWSRKYLSHFGECPSEFPAHITLLCDPFPLQARVVRRDSEDRSSWVHGLVQESPRRFEGKAGGHDGHFAWVRRAAPTSCPVLSAGAASAQQPGESDPSVVLALGLRAYGSLQAQVLVPPPAFPTSAEPTRGEPTPEWTSGVGLHLTPQAQSLLYSAHAVSTWVLTLDAHLGPDYFDTARTSDRPGYLLDFTPEFSTSGGAGGRQLLLTTRLDDEVSHLMQPALEQLDLDAEGPGAAMLMEALRSLSGRLALQLLSSPSQVQGALGMALSRLFAGAYGLLGQTLIVPIDAHPELTLPEQADAPRLRGDLMLVSADAASRHLDFLLVESKCYAGTGLNSSLRAGIGAQLANTEQVLRERFDPALRGDGRDRLDRSLQCWRLAHVLQFYRERAVRYGLVEPRLSRVLERFFNDLDRGYTLSVRKTGLVFHLQSPGTFLDNEVADVPVWVVGQEEVRRITQDAVREHREQLSRGAQDALAPAPTRRTTMAGHSTWRPIRSTFAGPTSLAEAPLVEPQDSQAQVLEASPSQVLVPENPEAEPLRVLEDTPSEVPRQINTLEDAPLQDASQPALPADPEPDEVPALAVAPVPVVVPQPVPAGARDDAEEPPYSVLLGDTRATPQWGLLGSVAAEPWRRVALDLNGCNTISIFGVQGSGKSYTVGTIVESAVRALPGSPGGNALPRPLGAVVFHTGRFTPTRVGSCPWRLGSCPCAPVHPHACGELLGGLFLEQLPCGSPPRVWGAAHVLLYLSTLGRFTPTRVGSWVCPTAKILKPSVHPHACGELAASHTGPLVNTGSPPRVWGADFNRVDKGLLRAL